MNTNIIFFVLALVVLVIGVPVCAGISYAMRTRHLQHLERMRAIELGQPVPGERMHESTPLNGAIAIGLGVPVGVFGVVWLANETAIASSEAWQAAGYVGVAGVVCGTILALRAKPLTNQGAVASALRAKPVQDPDTYDVAGQRG